MELSEGRPLRLEWVDPSSLDGNPKNWRKHPPLQKDAVEAVLDEVGWAGALLYNERSCVLVDGHLRKDLAIRKGIAAVPVLIGSWDEATEAKLLATLDPLAGLAQTDPAMLESLLRDVDTGNSALATLLSQLAEESRSASAAPESGDGASGDGDAPSGDAAADSPDGSERGAYLLEVSCPSEARRTDLMASLRADGYDCKLR